jgi:Tfp pilus assembly protein PilF
VKSSCIIDKLVYAFEKNRAEEYFKRAIEVEPPDAEAFNKYATFLWKVKNDLWAAEETYLEAISAEPSNTYYAANYAHFLWNTAGEDTCFPLSDDNSQEV